MHLMCFPSNPAFDRGNRPYCARGLFVLLRVRDSDACARFSLEADDRKLVIAIEHC